MAKGYRLWVSEESPGSIQILVRLWDSGRLEVATRPDPGTMWGPPVVLREEE